MTLRVCPECGGPLRLLGATIATEEVESSDAMGCDKCRTVHCELTIDGHHGVLSLRQVDRDNLPPEVQGFLDGLQRRN